ncbi:MAG: hypothetical protein D6729_11780 [Deltaproteobacteria bacterium]|nr:MAG: hypothetical protein D6729_11780 [Deltaproteobacteria bacterium]
MPTHVGDQGIDEGLRRTGACAEDHPGHLEGQPPEAVDDGAAGHAVRALGDEEDPPVLPHHAAHQGADGAGGEGVGIVEEDEIPLLHRLGRLGPPHGGAVAVGHRLQQGTAPHPAAAGERHHLVEVRQGEYVPKIALSAGGSEPGSSLLTRHPSAAS